MLMEKKGREDKQANGVDDGDRTHDHRSHNPGLYH